MAKSLKTLSLVAIVLANNSGCQSSPSPISVSTKIPTILLVDSETKLPDLFRQASTGEVEKKIRLPSGMLSISNISRRVAELREGPGVQFEIIPQILLKDTPVFETNRIENWVKVVAPTKDISGWLHKDTLQSMRTFDRSFDVRVELLPKVFLAKEIDRIEKFRTSEKIFKRLPKGTFFYKLKEEKSRVLVIIIETNSLAWLNRSDLS